MTFIRPGPTRAVSAATGVRDAPETIEVTSPAFAPGGPMPRRYSLDGVGVSPPLAWDGAPTEHEGLVLVVEDVDSPTLRPLVHAIDYNLIGRRHDGDQHTTGVLPEGALASKGLTGSEPSAGLNSYFKRGWLAPDPPPGNGPHRYLFQVFALRVPIDLAGKPGRTKLELALRGIVLARGTLIGTYERP